MEILQKWKCGYGAITEQEMSVCLHLLPHRDPSLVVCFFQNPLSIDVHYLHSASYVN